LYIAFRKAARFPSSPNKAAIRLASSSDAEGFCANFFKIILYLPYIRFYTGINRKQGVGAMQPRREKKIAQKEKKEDA
jgi:hypothetical protein